MKMFRFYIVGLAILVAVAGVGGMVCRAGEPTAQAAGASQADAPREYVELGRVVGYASPAEFAAFLQDMRRSEAPASSPSRFEGKGIFLILLMILGWGFLMNFLPCVLPMIPVNLAILTGMRTHGDKEAKANGHKDEGTREDGGMQGRKGVRHFLNGCVYGAGIAVAYGAIGLVALVTGSAFGAWHSTAWFNGIVAAFLVALALAMLDVFALDFSRLGRFKGGGIFGLGATSALLAGACVTPILVAVLVYSTQLYAKGQWFGLALPFVLGLGMAFPWPFVAVGVRMLPKPGLWMVWLKRAFAIILIGFAVHYARATYAAWALSRTPAACCPSPSSEERWTGLREALAEGKPVMLDFGASWCPACVAMERTTLKDVAVLRELEHFTVLKIDCEDPQVPDVLEMLWRFKVPGFPTFVVIAP